MASAKQTWETSFKEQIESDSYNTSPVEALVRSVSYYLRDRFPSKDLKQLRFLEIGCGAGPNLVWLARKGIEVNGVDISPTALKLARERLNEEKVHDRIGKLVERSAVDTGFENESMDGILEACVFQHLEKNEREKAFSEVKRLLKPGGLFVGYMLDRGHTVYQKKKGKEDKSDPGTLILKEGKSNIYLTNIGLSHFYSKDEILSLLSGFSTVDPCLATYYLPHSEAKKRGYENYLQSMWIVYAIK